MATEEINDELEQYELFMFCHCTLYLMLRCGALRILYITNVKVCAAVLPAHNYIPFTRISFFLSLFFITKGAEYTIG